MHTTRTHVAGLVSSVMLAAATIGCDRGSASQLPESFDAGSVSPSLVRGEEALERDVDDLVENPADFEGKFIVVTSGLSVTFEREAAGQDGTLYLYTANRAAIDFVGSDSFLMVSPRKLPEHPTGVIGRWIRDASGKYYLHVTDVQSWASVNPQA